MDDEPDVVATLVADPQSSLVTVTVTVTVVAAVEDSGAAVDARPPDAAVGGAQVAESQGEEAGAGEGASERESPGSGSGEAAIERVKTRRDRKGCTGSRIVNDGRGGRAGEKVTLDGASASVERPSPCHLTGLYTPHEGAWADGGERQSSASMCAEPCCYRRGAEKHGGAGGWSARALARPRSVPRARREREPGPRSAAGTRRSSQRRPYMLSSVRFVRRSSSSLRRSPCLERPSPLGLVCSPVHHS